MIVGQSLQERNLALSDLAGVVLVGGPLALLLASLAGYVLTGAALPPAGGSRRSSSVAVMPADEDRLALARSRLSAAELLDQAVERARRHPHAAGKRISVDAPDQPEVIADRDRAAQAIDNLLVNALRHADAHIHLSTRRNGALVELHVTDDGPGFPADFLPHAWERFARADAARTEDCAGLGLAIVHAIAEAHGGRAQARNIPTGGADVWIALPTEGARGCRSSPD